MAVFPKILPDELVVVVFPKILPDEVVVVVFPKILPDELVVVEFPKRLPDELVVAVFPKILPDELVVAVFPKILPDELVVAVFPKILPDELVVVEFPKRPPDEVVVVAFPKRLTEVVLVVVVDFSKILSAGAEVVVVAFVKRPPAVFVEVEFPKRLPLEELVVCFPKSPPESLDVADVTFPNKPPAEDEVGRLAGFSDWEPGALSPRELEEVVFAIVEPLEGGWLGFSDVVEDAELVLPPKAKFPGAEATGKPPPPPPPKENPELLPPSVFSLNRPPAADEGTFDVVKLLNENPPEEVVVATEDDVLNTGNVSGLPVDIVEFAEVVSTESGSLVATATEVGGGAEEPKEKLEVVVVVTVLEVPNDNPEDAEPLVDILLKDPFGSLLPNPLNTEEDRLLEAGTFDTTTDPPSECSPKLNGLEVGPVLFSLVLGFSRADFGVVQKLFAAFVNPCGVARFWDIGVLLSTAAENAIALLSLLPKGGGGVGTKEDEPLVSWPNRFLLTFGMRLGVTKL